MKKINSLELLKWLFWMVIAASTLGYVAVVTLDTVVNEVPKELYNCLPSLFVTIGLVVFYNRQLSRLDNHLPLKEKRELKQTNARSIKVNGTHTMFLSSVRSIFQSDLPQEPSQLLYWQYGTYTIKEDTAYEWLRKGWNRQLTGEPHPYSGNWMIRQQFHTLSGQRMKREYHECFTLLMSNYGLWLKEPTQGASGQIIASPAGCLAKLQGRWDN